MKFYYYFFIQFFTLTIFLSPSVGWSFDEKCYLERYPDVVSDWVKPGGKAIDHWIQHGQIEHRNPDCDKATQRNFSISKNVFGKPLVISTSQRFAGAIDSLKWDGQEFINIDDHGRQLQSASSFDGFGECLNPTEAGSSRDGAGSTSTSKLLGLSSSAHRLKTTNQMAFWMPANAPYPSGCGEKNTYTKAQNTTDISSDLFSKQVTIGFRKIENVIEYLVTFKVSENHKSAVFEALTGYMPANFSSFWTYDPKTSSLATLSKEMSEQSLPIIFSTPDKRYAMGIYAPDLPQANFPGIGYGRFDYSRYNTMKWNAVFRRLDTPIGSYDYKTFVIVGNLEQVMKGMQSVHDSLKLPSPKK